jgi:deoxyribonuclease V
MKYRQRHPWDISPREAIEIQKRLQDEVVRSNDFCKIGHVAGIDVGFEDGKARAAAAVLNFPSLELAEYAISRMPVTFPYIPGLLSFREVPAVLDALEKLSIQPDLLLCDGQGIAHPRRFGIACHIGILTGLPTIGVAKTRLTGSHEAVGEEKGDWKPLLDKNEIIGGVLRTRKSVKPLYISIGHRIDLETAIKYVMASTTRYRLPETTRWAHRLASQKSSN